MRIPSVSLVLLGALILAACGSEQTKPADRDLTLLTPATESGAVVSAREMAVVRTENGVSELAPVRHTNAVTRTRVPRASSAPAAAEPVPDQPTPAASVADAAPVAGGAGQALEPGQTVTVVPATSAGVSPGREPGPFIEPVVNRGRPHIDGDRCIPGRGEVMPRGPGAFPGRPSVPNGFRISR